MRQNLMKRKSNYVCMYIVIMQGTRRLGDLGLDSCEKSVDSVVIKLETYN